MKNTTLYIKILGQRIKNLKLRYRIILFLFTITIITCGITGNVGYREAKNDIVANMTGMSIKLMKEVGTNLDSRIDSYLESVNRLLMSDDISAVLYNRSSESDVDLRTQFRSKLVQQDSLFEYTDYAIFQDRDSRIYTYIRSGVHLTNDDAEMLMDQMAEDVTTSQMTEWVNYQNSAYLVRRIFRNGEDLGVIIFKIRDNFFDYGGNVQEYFTSEDTVTVSSEGQILNNTGELDAALCTKLVNHSDGHFYVYTTLRSIKGVENLCVILKLPNSGWFIIGKVPYYRMLKDISDLRITMLIVTLILLAAEILLTTLLLRTFTKNLEVIDKGLIEFEQGHFLYKLRPYAYDELGKLALQINHMGMKIDQLEKNVLAKEEEKKKAEIQVLQAAINPHFLYNTLSSVKFFCIRKDEKETADIIDAVIQLLRFTLHNTNKIIRFKEEIAYIENYIKIERMRFDDGFNVDIDVEKQVEDLLIPGFILQPIVENSIIHGFDMRKKDNRIEIHAWLDNDTFYISEKDNGVGMSDEQIEKILNSDDSGETKYEGLNSIGINIIDKRLQNFYGDEYYMMIDSVKDQGTEVTLCIPMNGKANYEKADNDC